MANQFRCTHRWARNEVGDIVEEYEIVRYPLEIRAGNFEPVVVKAKTQSTPKVTAPATVTPKSAKITTGTGGSAPTVSDTDNK